MGLLDLIKPKNENVQRLKDRGDVEGLIRALYDRFDPERRRMAVIALGEISDARSVEPLSSMILDTDFRISFEAAKALSCIGAPALESLCAALKSNYDDVRNIAAKSLGQLNDPRAIGPLCEALKNTDRGIFNEAANTLILMGEPVVTTLCNVFAHSYGESRFKAIQVLQEIGEPAIEPLLVCLKDVQIGNRIFAAEALGKSGNEFVVEPLCKALKDREPLFIQQVAVALGNLGNAQAIEPLRRLINHSSFQVRHAAIEALAKMGVQTEEHKEQIAQAPAKPDWDEILTSEGIESKLLFEALRNRDVKIRKEAALALEKHGTPDNLSIKIHYLIAMERWNEITAFEKEGAELLFQAYKELTHTAANFTHAWVPQGATYPASERWYWNDISSRYAIVKALAKIGDEKAVEVLSWISQHDRYTENRLEYEDIPAKEMYWPIREEAEEALEHITKGV